MSKPTPPVVNVAIRIVRVPAVNPRIVIELQRTRENDRLVPANERPVDDRITLLQTHRRSVVAVENPIHVIHVIARDRVVVHRFGSSP